MGRAPCCDKANVKRGPWSPEEDSKLKAFIEQHGTGGNWIALPQKIGLKRCGKSCRLRWLNYLRPNIKHGGFSEEEDNIICNLYISIGSRWSIIAAQLPGRTDNDIKNYWNTRLKKKLLGKQRKEQHARRSSLKAQEMKKGIISGNFMNTATADHSIGTQNVYYPGPSMPLLGSSYQNQGIDPCLNDHTSIRKLLIRLGGRFSDDPNSNNVHAHQQPIGEELEVIKNLGCTHYDEQQEFYGNPSLMDDWFPMNSMNINPCCDNEQLLMNNQLNQIHDVDGVAMNHMLQQQGVVLNSIDQVDELDAEMVCSANNPHKIDQGSSSSSELFYGDSMANDQSSSPSTWVDMTSFVYPPPPTVTNYEVSQPRMLQGYTTFEAPKQQLD